MSKEPEDPTKVVRPEFDLLKRLDTEPIDPTRRLPQLLDRTLRDEDATAEIVPFTDTTGKEG